MTSLPAPDPAAVRALARQALLTADRLRRRAGDLRALAAADPLWVGAAAESLRGRCAALAPRFVDSAGALDELARTLGRYADHLDDALARLTRVDAESRAARGLRSDLAVELRLVALRAEVATVRHEVAEHGSAVARALRRAADAAPEEPSWVARRLGDVDAWVGHLVRDHATAVERVSLGLGAASSVAALVPGGGPGLAVGLAAGGAAASGLLVRYTEADGGDLALAAAGLLTTGVGTAGASAVRAARTVAAGGAVGRREAAGARVVAARGEAVVARTARAADATGAGLLAWSGAALVAGSTASAPPRARAAGATRLPAWSAVHPGAALTAPGAWPPPALDARPVAGPVAGPGLPGCAPEDRRQEPAGPRRTAPATPAPAAGPS